MDQKATLFYVETSYDEDSAMLEAAEAWLEKWEGQYKIVKDHGQNNEIILEMDLYCTQDALDAIPEGVNCNTSWSSGELTEDDVLYGQGPRSKHREKQIRNMKKEG